MQMKEERALGLSVRLSPEEMEAVEEVASRTFRKKADVVRMALAMLIEAEKEKREGVER